MNGEIGFHQDPPYAMEYMDFYLTKTKTLLGAGSTAAKIKVLGATNGPIPIKVNNRWFVISDDDEITIATALDTGSIQAGKDYNIYICDNNGVKEYKVSLNSTYPTGYTASTSRKIGGFHTLCVDVGTISGHALSGYTAGQILPASVWDLKHRAASLNNAGLVYDDRINKWVQIYLASDDGASGVQSVYGATILDSTTWNDFVDKGGKSKLRLLKDDEFQIIAQNSNEQTNITGSADPVTTGGHVDTAGRRMISDIGVEDAAGVEYQWLLDQSYRFDGAAAHTHEVTVTGEAQTVTSGNPSVDVAPTWGWADPGGSKGNVYKQGTYGDVKLLAGGNWDYGSACGSRCRDADSGRWYAYSFVGGRFAVESL